jgi:hypothetical protein
MTSSKAAFIGSFLGLETIASRSIKQAKMVPGCGRSTDTRRDRKTTVAIYGSGSCFSDLRRACSSCSVRA